MSRPAAPPQVGEALCSSGNVGQSHGNEILCLAFPAAKSEEGERINASWQAFISASSKEARSWRLLTGCR